jgi:PAS domain S-box-containing protein
MTAFEQTLEAILVTDPVGIIQYVNPAFEQITGFTRKEAIGQNPRILNSGHQNAGFYEELWKTISTGGKWKGRFINKKKDGILFTDETSISPVLNEKGEITNYVGVKRDITSELSLQTQLTQAQKLEGIGTLASGIAHDFNNILGIIMGHTSLLDRVREDPNMYAESVAAIMKATQRGASLVKQIMLFARKTEPLLESVKVNVIIGEITKLLQETLPKTITISISLQQDLPAIVADSSQVHQVLLNLILNARDAMEKGGTLSISTRTIEGETVRSRFPKVTRDRVTRQYVQIEVTDTGIGMDESTRQRIFEPFFTTKGVGKGTGLGLAVVFGIVEYHHGFIDVQSARGEGTSFAVYFPIPVHTGEEIHASGKKLEDLPGGTETILIIEDEAVLMKLAKNILVSKGYAVLTAEDGMQGVELYRSHQKEIAVVLSDIGLPVFGGHDVFRKIRAINPEAKIIFASGFFDPETKSEMYKAGLKNFIQKPYMQNEVLQKIRETIDSTTTIKNGGF